MWCSFTKDHLSIRCNFHLFAYFIISIRYIQNYSNEDRLLSHINTDKTCVETFMQYRFLIFNSFFSLSISLSLSLSIFFSLFIIINADLSSIPHGRSCVKFIKWYMKFGLHVWVSCADAHSTDGQLSSSLCENEFDVKVHLDLHLNLMWMTRQKKNTKRAGFMLFKIHKNKNRWHGEMGTF